MEKVKKAKEYAQEFISNVTDLQDKEKLEAEIKKMTDGFFEDMRFLIKERNISKDEGLIPVVKELNAKWNSVKIKLKKHYGVNVIVDNGMSLLIKQNFPDFYSFYKSKI